MGLVHLAESLCELRLADPETGREPEPRPGGRDWNSREPSEVHPGRSNTIVAAPLLAPHIVI